MVISLESRVIRLLRFFGADLGFDLIEESKADFCCAEGVEDFDLGFGLAEVEKDFAETGVDFADFFLVEGISAFFKLDCYNLLSPSPSNIGTSYRFYVN